MNSQLKKLSLTIVLGATFFLAGCSSEPSSGDIESSIKNLVEGSNAKLDQIGGNNPFVSAMKVEFISARKISCTPVENAKSKFSCEVEIETKAPVVGIQKAIKTVTFLKDGNEWKVVA